MQTIMTVTWKGGGYSDSDTSELEASSASACDVVASFLPAEGMLFGVPSFEVIPASVPYESEVVASNC